MPLKCFRDDEPILAFDVESDEAWDGLREENAIRKNLRMPCCGAGVTLRTSKLGTKHFAHARRGPCSTAPESAQHLLAKRTIVEGARRTPWNAVTEQAGESAEFGPWIADVLASKGKSNIAFEVQWSRQDDGETRRRQARYASPGVRGLWLMRQHDFPKEKDIPAFRLVFDEASRAFSVQLPSPEHHPWLGSKESNDAANWSQSIELSRFVEGALSGRLRFAPVLGLTMPVEVFTEPTTCWKCKGDTRLVLGIVFAASRVLPGCADVELTLHSFGDQLEDGAEVVARMLPAALLRKHGIGELRPRRSKTEGGAYLSNGCVHCGALQGRFFEHKHGYDMEKSLEVEARFEAAWGSLMEDAAGDIQRWWFDEGAWAI
jgi:hypothetical protein